MSKVLESSRISALDRNVEGLINDYQYTIEDIVARITSNHKIDQGELAFKAEPETDNSKEDWLESLRKDYGQTGTDPKTFVAKQLKRFGALGISRDSRIMKIRRSSNKKTPEHTIKEAIRLYKRPEPLPAGFDIKLRMEVDEIERRKTLEDKGKNWE